FAECLQVAHNRLNGSGHRGSSRRRRLINKTRAYQVGANRLTSKSWFLVNTAATSSAWPAAVNTWIELILLQQRIDWGKHANKGAHARELNRHESYVDDVTSQQAGRH